MRRIAAALTVPILTAATVLGSGGLETARAQSTENVEVGNLYFCSPSFQNGVCETTITAGDTVVWDDVAGLHTVTECNADFSVCPPVGGFDSGVIGVGTSFSQAFDTPGTFSYRCSFHPAQMRGRIIVQEPTPTPSPTPTSMPTSTPVGGTVSPAPTVTGSPAAVPQTGAAASGGLPVSVVVTLAGMTVAVLGVAVVLRLSTRRT
jgi:plastocyanin